MKQLLSAVVFPGQGTQKTGMGKDFYDNLPASRAVFEEASEVLGWDVARMCFLENQKMNLTEYAQPCILTTEIAMFRGVREMIGFSPEYFGGHSLGEYAALVAAGVMPFDKTVKVVQERGRLMQTVSPEGFGGMAAVIGKGGALDSIAPFLKDLPVDIANINSSEQIVISGETDALLIAEQRIRAVLDSDPSFRYVPLAVSAPFHSRFMRPMQAGFKAFVVEALADTIVADSADRVLSNYTGGFHAKDKELIIDALVSQISAPVQWLKNMEALTGKVETIYEIGPNRPLRGFFSSVGVNCAAITHFAAAQRVFGTNGKTGEGGK